MPAVVTKDSAGPLRVWINVDELPFIVYWAQNIRHNYSSN